MKEHLREIREILVKIWDPLNVEGNSSIEDEYDSYLPRISRLSSEEGVIEAELKAIEIELGLTSESQTRRRQAAIALSLLLK